MTALLLHRRDHVVQPRVEARPARRRAWLPLMVAGVVVAGVVTTAAVTWDGGPAAGVVVVDPGQPVPVPHPQPGPLARPDR